MPMRATLLAYSQVREYEEGESRGQIIEAIYKSVYNLAKALIPKRK
jgi:hypothetical protein